MKKPLMLAVCAALFAAPAAAQAAPMDAMQYYVGSWHCTAASTGKPLSKATVTADLKLGVLRQWIAIETAPGKPPYAFEAVASFDAKKHRFVQTTLDTEGFWNVSVASPWTGNTERWTDIGAADGKLNREITVRSANSFVFHSYYPVSSTAPNFTASCTRDS